MESIKVRQHIGPDGVLHLDIPVGITGQDIDVVVIYQPVPSETEASTVNSSPNASTEMLKKLEKVQAMVRKFVPEGQSLVDELIADRRSEAARE